MICNRFNYFDSLEYKGISVSGIEETHYYRVLKFCPLRKITNCNTFNSNPARLNFFTNKCYALIRTPFILLKLNNFGESLKNGKKICKDSLSLTE